MRKRRKMSIMIFMIMMVGIFTLSTRVEAALQANGGTPVTANLNDWVSGVRQMQATGGTLGLTDTINTNLTSSNKNMDIHMQKNTEYGAMAILSASAYGNPNKITDGQTTTGNASGIVMKLNWELVAAGTTNNWAGNMTSSAKRYWNVYADTYSAKKGDAIAETAGWHGSGMSLWFKHVCYGHGTSTQQTSLLRGYSGSIFSYCGQTWDRSGMNCWDAGKYSINVGPTGGGAGAYFWAQNPYYTRAAVVVGSGV